MTAREPVVPTVEVTLSDAVEDLNGFESITIEDRFGRKFEDLGAIRLTYGCVWAYENRGDKKRSWASVQALSMREAAGYFTPEPDDVDETDPDSDVGKDDSSGAVETLI